MKPTFFSDGIFLDRPLNRIYWSAAILKIKKQNTSVLCDFWEQTQDLENRWNNNNSGGTYPPIFQNAAYNIKAMFSEDCHTTVIHICKSQDACSAQKDHLALCSFQSLANTHTLPVREITMSDHVGHQAASRRHRSITSGSCWPAICHQLHHELGEGHSSQSLA